MNTRSSFANFPDQSIQAAQKQNTSWTHIPTFRVVMKSNSIITPIIFCSLFECALDKDQRSGQVLFALYWMWGWVGGVITSVSRTSSLRVEVLLISAANASLASTVETCSRDFSIQFPLPKGYCPSSWIFKNRLGQLGDVCFRLQ